MREYIHVCVVYKCVRVCSIYDSNTCTCTCVETHTGAAVSRELALKQRLHLQCLASTKVTNGLI